MSISSKLPSCDAVDVVRRVRSPVEVVGEVPVELALEGADRKLHVAVEHGHVEIVRRAVAVELGGALQGALGGRERVGGVDRVGVAAPAAESDGVAADAHRAVQQVAVERRREGDRDVVVGL